MNEYEIYQKEVISIMTDFLNRTIEGEENIGDTTDSLARKFALTQEQRAAVKITLGNLSMVNTSYGELKDGFVGIAINLITHIVLKDWQGVEDMLNDETN